MKPEIKYGLHITAALSLILVLGGLLDANLSWIELLVIGAGIYLSVRESHLHQPGFMSFGQIFRPGFRSVLLAAPALGVFSYIYYKFINHPLALKLRTEGLATMDKQFAPANIPADQLAMQRRITEMMIGPGGLAVAEMFRIFIVGIICCLLIAFFMKKDDPNKPRRTPLDDKDWD